MTAFLTWPYLATGASTPRTSPDRWRDARNVLDYGVTGNGVTDDSAAIAACVAQQGSWIFPPRTYLVNSTVQLPIGSFNGGESYSLSGYGATIVGNFAGWLMLRERGNENSQPKIIEGFQFTNLHAAGGLVNFNQSVVRMQNCYFDLTGMGGSGGSQGCCMGFAAASADGPYAVVNCAAVGFSLTPIVNQTGICIPNGIGGEISGCNVVHLDRGIVAAGGGGSGCRISNNRLEVNNWGITVGWGMDFQQVLSSAPGPGSDTLLNMTTTIMYRVGDFVSAVNFSGAGWGGNTGNAFHGSTIVSLTTTQIRVTTSSYQAMPGGSYLYVSAPGGNTLLSSSYGPGGTGVVVEANGGEGNIHAIRLHGGTSTVVQGNGYQLYHQGGGRRLSEAGVAFTDGCNAMVVQANQFSGQCTGSPIYYLGGGNNVPPYNSLIQNQANTNMTELCMVSTGVTGGNSFQLFQIPRWLNDAINLHPINVYIQATRGNSFPSGTTVATAVVGTGVMTTSNAQTGAQPQYAGFLFSTTIFTYSGGGVTAGTYTPIGQVSLV